MRLTKPLQLISCAIIASLIIANFVNAENPPRNGIHKTYYPDGTVKTEELYKNGKRHGMSMMYNERGKLDRKVKFENGEVVSSYKFTEKKDLGPLNIIYNVKFWITLVIVILILGFFLIKLFFKDRPF